MNERDTNSIIAVLVARLGGSVAISMHDIARYGRRPMVRFDTFDPPTIHLEVDMPPPAAIDAEFEVVGEARRIGT